MSYTALYRKFRPQEFSDVKGQDAIVTTLKNQIEADRIGHAYLFCGTRGTGKTTLAKIFAKAVNCEHPVGGSPCGVCQSCQSIASGSSMNVIEIDAASNNGVENIRDIRDNVAYRPTEGKYKVYIIDEVHMLSTGAFNALLKTLEEPPSYVIFILATTETHTIPVTILSRCQRYDFKRISVDTISSRLKELLDKEGIEAEEQAIQYIAKSADGALRDALSLLDQCIAFYLGEKLTYEKVLEVLGAVDTEVFRRLLQSVLAENVSQVIAVVESLVVEGRELRQFVVEFTWYLRNLLLVKTSDCNHEALDLSEENYRQMAEDVKEISTEDLFRFIRIFSELSGEMKYSMQKRIVLEVALIKLCRPQMERDYDSLVQRMEQMEKKLERGIVVSPQQTSQLAQTNEAAVGEKLPLPEALPEELEEIGRNFRNYVSEMSGLYKTYLKDAMISPGENSTLKLVITDDMSYSFFSRDEEREHLEKVISDRVGKEIHITLQMNDTGRPSNEVSADLEQVIHFDIEEED